MLIFPTRVLLATDGSRDATLAARTAADLAQKTGSELHVVHVGIQYFLFVHDYISPAQYERLKQECQAVLDEQVGRIQAAGGSVAGAHLRMGRRIDEEVVNLAEELGAGLIVVGSKGDGKLSRALMGSTSDSIVHHAPCPVLVVRQEKDRRRSLAHRPAEARERIPAI